ncbi:MAG: hypothetical protein AABO57_15410 [Acidobacteriota bacterium]
MSGGKSALPSFAPKTRVEVYLPVRYEAAYQETLAWVIREFTELHGGCTVIENAGGYYLSNFNQIIDDRVSLIYCDLPMNWSKRRDRIDALKYSANLQSFLLKNLWEESVLIAVYPVSHSAV